MSSTPGAMSDITRHSRMLDSASTARKTMRERHRPFIIASEKVQTRISVTSSVIGESRNETMNSAATSRIGMQSHLLSPSR